VAQQLTYAWLIDDVAGWKEPVVRVWRWIPAGRVAPGA